MLTAKDVALVMETLLSPPYMNDEVKVSFRASRKAILLLAKTIELGLSQGDGEHQVLFAAVNEQTVESVKGFSAQMLNIAGLTDMYEKMQALQVK